MTRDELLTKLAMDLYYWPEGPCYTPYGWGCELDDGEVVITNESRTLHARKEHWLDRRIELINEPDDADAPDGMNWRCQLPSGEWWWCSHKPELDFDTWVRPSVKGCASRFAQSGAIPAGHRWQDTLREVKREHPQPRATFEVTPEEEEAFKALEASAGKDWRGPEDGLPPVGTVCEFKLHHEDDSAYQECYIVGESKDKE